MGEILARAKKDKYGVGAFNFTNIEVLETILKTAERLRSPVIVETSEREMNFLGAEVIAASFKVLAESLTVPAVLHLDHGKSLTAVQSAVTAGYSSVHIDGSLLTDPENIKITRAVVGYAREHGIFVEGEIGRIPGTSTVHKQDERKINVTDLTNPAAAASFFAATKIDCLAVSIGNLHGVYPGRERLGLNRLGAIAEIVRGFLSLHGGSGINETDVKSAIQLGIQKINVNTELRQAFIGGIRSEMVANPEEIRPYAVLPEALVQVAKVVEEKIYLFGSHGKY